MTKFLGASMVSSGPLNMQTSKVTNLGAGADPGDGINKTQFDSVGAPADYAGVQQYLADRQELIQFTDSPADALIITAGNPFNLKVGVTDGDGVGVPIPPVPGGEVTLIEDSNTTGQALLINGTPIGAGFIVDLSSANEVTLAITQAASGIGSVVLSLSDTGGSGLDVSDTFDITYT